MPLWFLYAVPTPLTVWLFVKLSLPRRNGLRVVVDGLLAGLTTRGGMPVVLMIVGVLLANSSQSYFDPTISSWLGYDLTGFVHSFEGDLVGAIQAPIRDSLPIAYFLTWIYICGYVALLLTPPIVWRACDRNDVTPEYLAAFLFNYGLALPFYLFFPVVEVGHSGFGTAVPLMESVFQGISDQIRYESALDNCFPSLHVSCSVTALWFAHLHGPKGMRWVAWFVALATVYSVLALGIHWGADVMAGIPFGIGCAYLGTAATNRFRSTLGLPVARST